MFVVNYRTTWLHASAYIEPMAICSLFNTLAQHAKRPVAWLVNIDSLIWNYWLKLMIKPLYLYVPYACIPLIIFLGFYKLVNKYTCWVRQRSEYSTSILHVQPSQMNFSRWSEKLGSIVFPPCLLPVFMLLVSHQPKVSSSVTGGSFLSARWTILKEKRKEQLKAVST